MAARILIIVAALLLVVALARPDLLGLSFALPDRDQLLIWIEAAGVWGPIVVVGVMTLAIVVSPLPSAPIALAAGAAYGHGFGTALVLLGAELGALVAFVLARKLGRPIIERYVGQSLGKGLLGSQNMLTFLVFASRLLPFLSFDLISYAAGLSKLHLWRFALATLAGIIPASFFLAHLGSVAMEGEARSILWTVAALGLVSGASLLLAIYRKKRTGPKVEPVLDPLRSRNDGSLH